MIVLLTDFGESEYVGVMRGVIASLSPSAQILDLTHSIPPQSIMEGAWVLLQDYGQFPIDSIFVAVVDPGVGTGRAAVMVRTEDYTFIGPDNGLLYPAIHDNGIVEIHELVIDPFASKTFHGRDVFARAAGLLSAGLIGEIETKPLSELRVPLSFFQSGNEGQIVRIDRFGNIISNIPSQQVQKSDHVTLISRLGSLRIPLVETYDEGPDGGLFTLVGSYGTYEIAAKNEPASAVLGLTPGDRISLQ